MGSWATANWRWLAACGRAGNVSDVGRQLVADGASVVTRKRDFATTKWSTVNCASATRDVASAIALEPAPPAPRLSNGVFEKHSEKILLKLLKHKLDIVCPFSDIFYFNILSNDLDVSKNIFT